jgi:hypothetical protein
MKLVIAFVVIFTTNMVFAQTIYEGDFYNKQRGAYDMNMFGNYSNYQLILNRDSTFTMTGRDYKIKKSKKQYGPCNLEQGKWAIKNDTLVLTEVNKIRRFLIKQNGKKLLWVTYDNRLMRKIKLKKKIELLDYVPLSDEE